ncbi:sensor histidine kinase [Streptomyces sp. AK08-02]|uniref:sensor histidine kinase n=1 Tax=Streptomyces sp. AK08-02 TaxID=3028654 RepID=UPI0029B10CA3|nr:histidine kinase [Streptomyces sp. AK08-02]MDX3751779.1 histidine kinase [Streptomyces sp. AK08-02]
MPAPHPDERRFLQALTSDPEQRVIASAVSRLASWRRADLARPRVRQWGVPALCLAVGSDAYTNPHNVTDPQLPIVLAFCIPLLWRERRPMLIFALTTAVSIVSLPLGVLTGAEFARVVALFNVGRHCTPRQLAAATGITLVQLVAWAYFFWRGQQLEYVTRPEPVTLMVMVAVVAFAALGLLLRLAYAYIDVLKKQRDQLARLATAQERARVSREMHDILGHTLAVIVGLADGAAPLTAAKPERGAQTLRIISASGRDALAELRRLFSVIGDDRDDRAGQGRSYDVPLAPQPGLADLDALLDRVRAVGPTVALHAHGDLTGLAPGLQLSAYRVIQEALTNTVKYAASGTSVHVSIAADPGTVRITVEDTGPSRAPGTHRGRTGGGRGLVGMRERAALYRGEVTAGPNPHGGWTVHATLIPNPPANSLEIHPA